MKAVRKWFILVLVAMVLLASCPQPSGNGGNDDGNSNEETVIIFDNTKGICEAVIYSDSSRNEKLCEVEAGGLSEPISWTPQEKCNFYQEYVFSFEDMTLTYTPLPAKIISMRVQADETNSIIIPPLADAVDPPDALLSTKSGVIIENNFSYSFTLTKNSTVIMPEGLSNSLVQPGETPHYEINGDENTLSYKITVNGVGYSFPEGIFKQGYVMRYTFNGSSVSLLRETAITATAVQNSSGSETANPIPLTAGTWKDGSITRDKTKLYSFPVNAGMTYYIWWNDRYEGTGSKTCDILVSGYTRSGSTTAAAFFNLEDAAWTSPRQFTASYSGTVLLLVEGYSDSSSGTYAIAYGTSSSRPSGIQ